MANPFIAGAANFPPHLAGRLEIRAALVAGVDRLRSRETARTVALVGQRGVGKTVLLLELIENARERGDVAVRVHGHPDADSGVAAQLLERAGSLVADLGLSARARKALSGVVVETRTRVGFGLAEHEVTTKQASPSEQSLRIGLEDVLRSLGEAARSKDKVIVLAIDELQDSHASDLRSVGALIQTVNAERLPILITVAGLSSMMKRAAEAGATSFTERLHWHLLENLTLAQTSEAVQVPLAKMGRTVTAPALNEIHRLSLGYPYSVQLLAAATLDAAAEASTITIDHVHRAEPTMKKAMSDGLYAVRWHKMSPAEQNLARHLAALESSNGESVESSRVYASMGVAAQTLTMHRQRMIFKGVIEQGDAHATLRFTAPGFGEWVTTNHPLEQIAGNEAEQRLAALLAQRQDRAARNLAPDPKLEQQFQAVLAELSQQTAPAGSPPTNELDL